MKKTIVAVMVAASAVLSAQAFAAGNSSSLTILGNVTDTGESCNVTPSAMISGGSLTLDDVKASVLDAMAVNTPYMSTAKDIEYKIEDCQKGATWIGPYISRHFLSLYPLLVRRRRYSRGERYPSALCGCHSL